jgi:hypothetical protein
MDTKNYLFISTGCPHLWLWWLYPNITCLLDLPLCEGISVLQPPRFYPCPFGRDHFKALWGLDVWKLCFALCFQNLWFILVRNLRHSVMLWVFSSNGNLSLFWEFLKWWANESYNTCCPTSHYKEGCCRYHSVECGQKGRVDDLGESTVCVVFSGYRNERCHDWGVWLLKKTTIKKISCQ